MIHPTKQLAAALGLGLFAMLAHAQATPAGLWKTIDDETKQDEKCDKCTDARKDQPKLGMVIIEGVKKHADEPYWDGGTILDPNNGKTYRVRLTPKDGGRTLEVRGYIGPFYRNQTWLRVE